MPDRPGRWSCLAVHGVWQRCRFKPAEGKRRRDGRESNATTGSRLRGDILPLIGAEATGGPGEKSVKLTGAAATSE